MQIQYSGLLNKEQLKAVTTLGRPLLVIAGAGSGKTRVITYRIAHALEKGVKQSEILAVTFTNKAAMEMKQRIRAITGLKLQKLTVSTFHAFGVSVLKKHGSLLGYKQNFSIYDQSDRDSLIKEIINEDRKGDIKDTHILSDMFSRIKMGREDTRLPDENITELYNMYQLHLKSYNAVDFDDLIILPVELFTLHGKILEEYQKQYRHILIDEFQDTSEAQYKLIRMLGNKIKNICAVGDDDQSIYSWRGADFGNIIRFEKDFPETLEIKLEQNYRSTSIILSAANELIKNNTVRKLKTLRSTNKKENLIQLYFPDNEREEGEWIADKIRTLSIRHSLKYHDFSVLVRTNHLTRHIEEAFLRDNLPYKVSGGISFFQRREIKDIIAYLKVLANPDDNINLLRILNVPRRGIGLKTVEKLINLAEIQGTSLFSIISALRFSEKNVFEKNINDSLTDFITLVDYYREIILKGKNMAKAINSMVDSINYWGHLLSGNKKKQIAQWKYQNIMSFLESIKEYETDPDNPSPNIYEYLNRITLNSKDEQSGDIRGKVHIMTIHSAKGLEFDTVFIAGLENGIIPHLKALSDDEKMLEEERRLLYVAVTRAKNRLFLTSCKTRKRMGKPEESGVSPFLKEIPEKYIQYCTEETEETEGQDDSGKDYFALLKKRFFVK